MERHQYILPRRRVLTRENGIKNWSDTTNPVEHDSTWLTPYRVQQSAEYPKIKKYGVEKRLYSISFYKTIFYILVGVKETLWILATSNRMAHSFPMLHHILRFTPFFCYIHVTGSLKPCATSVYLVHSTDLLHLQGWFTLVFCYIVFIGSLNSQCYIKQCGSLDYHATSQNLAHSTLVLHLAEGFTHS